jgi:hypothetical protein
VAAVLVGGAVLSACLIIVQPGEAVVVTRFGNPARVDGMPGIAWRAPLPIENTINVDLRLRTTSSGLHDVATHDGLRSTAICGPTRSTPARSFGTLTPDEVSMPSMMEKAGGGAISGYGRTIAEGMLYLNSGGGYFGPPGNALLAFSVDGK